MFQSPCGDLLIGNLDGKPLPSSWQFSVSVPLRGFINRKLGGDRNIPIKIWGFSPLAGIY